MMPCLVASDRADANLRRADQLATQTKSAYLIKRSPKGSAAGVREKESRVLMPTIMLWDDLFFLWLDLN